MGVEFVSIVLRKILLHIVRSTITKIAWKLAGDKSLQNAFDQVWLAVTITVKTARDAYTCARVRACVSRTYSRAWENSVELTINHRSASTSTIIYSLRGHAKWFFAHYSKPDQKCDRCDHKHLNRSSKSLFFFLFPSTVNIEKIEDEYVQVDNGADLRKILGEGGGGAKRQAFQIMTFFLIVFIWRKRWK